MSVSLYDHQREAVDKLDSGKILCGGVGTGKSRTALAYYFEKECGGDLSKRIHKMKNPKDLYIITTARKRDTKEWDLECIPFRISENPLHHLYSTKVVIDSWNNIGKYKDVKDSFFIFDEQRVVGKGEWVKSFLKISKKNRWILLSATPGDSWNDYVPVFVANGFYKNRSEFIREHVVYDPYVTKFPKISKYIREGRLLRYRHDILVDMRFTKTTVPHDETLYVEFDKELYKKVMRSRWDPYKNAPIATAADLCYVLRKVSNSHPSRINEVIKIANEKNKVIVFYNFDYELDILKHADYGDGFVVAEWNGHEHEPIPKSDKWVYLVQYAAGAEGWNCIETDTIIFYSQSYSYKTTVQASGRIDRLNSPFIDLYFYKLKSKSAIDLAIGRALRHKKDFNIRRFVQK